MDALAELAFPDPRQRSLHHLQEFAARCALAEENNSLV